jgi:hypothetical protein
MDIDIGDINYRIYKNVSYESCNPDTSELYFRYYNRPLDETNDIHYFLLFEVCCDSAFGHWIYESAIMLIFYEQLKAKYPKLKLLVKSVPKRSYKKLFFDALNILEEDIYWLEVEEKYTGNIAYENIPINNICISTQIFFLNTVPIKRYDLFKRIVLKFKEIILHNLDIKYPDEKPIDILFFPRSKNGENYKVNDREIDYSKVNNMLKNKKYTEYDTANTKKLKDQIELLVSSKHIFLEWGSSFVVNMLFCRDSNIYIYNVHDIPYLIRLQPYRLLCEINDNNKLNYIYK